MPNAKKGAGSSKTPQSKSLLPKRAESLDETHSARSTAVLDRRYFATPSFYCDDIDSREIKFVAPVVRISEAKQSLEAGAYAECAYSGRYRLLARLA
ncbi:MAG: hypothetical protein VXZ82_06040 [Planctomycetota bacterium]|nr:hypothetical protein [Planctomycetota bacterium]